MKSSSSTCITKSGTNYSVDESGFLLRNGEFITDDNGSNVLYLGFIEMSRFGFHGYLRVHDVFVYPLNCIKRYIDKNNKVKILGISEKKLKELFDELNVNSIEKVYQALHKQNPVQEFPYSFMTSLVVSFEEK